MCHSRTLAQATSPSLETSALGSRCRPLERIERLLDRLLSHVAAENAGLEGASFHQPMLTGVTRSSGDIGGRWRRRGWTRSNRLPMGVGG